MRIQDGELRKKEEEEEEGGENEKKRIRACSETKRYLEVDYRVPMG